ncbi:hypothetical protein GGI12_004473, partial [Dipsacomyces acuminosporus]
MGISAIFKRSKATPPQSSTDASLANTRQAPHHAEQCYTQSDDSDVPRIASSSRLRYNGHEDGKPRNQQHSHASLSKSTRIPGDAMAVPEKHKNDFAMPLYGAARAAKNAKEFKTFVQPHTRDTGVASTLPTSDPGELPTPRRCLKEPAGANGRLAGRLAGSDSSPSKTFLEDKQGQNTDSSLFGLYSLATPPIDTHPPHLRGDLDPFEDAPSSQRLTDFEDPIYIPPLALTAALFDDYSAIDAALGADTSTTSATTTIANRSTPSDTFDVAASRKAYTASSHASAAASSLGVGSTDLLSEFTATYNYLFGTLPTDSAATAPAQSTDFQTNEAISARSHVLPDFSNGDTIKAAGQTADLDDGTSSIDDSDATDAVASTLESVADESTNPNKELEEERRREEERKAAEMRSRRRELIKQQPQQRPSPPDQFIAAYPVRLAGIPKSTTNTYLSDDSSDDASESIMDSSDADCEGDMQSMGNSKAAYNCPSPIGSDKETDDQISNVDLGGTSASNEPVVYSPSESALAEDDHTVVRSSESDASISRPADISPCSSSRRVRFRDTVSVVFNIRNSTTEDDFEYEHAPDSDYDSSNASLDLESASK